MDRQHCGLGQSNWPRRNMRGTIFSGRVAEEGPYQEINQSDGETLSYKSKQWRWSSSKEIREEDNIGDSIGSNANLLETLPDPSTKKGKQQGSNH